MIFLGIETSCDETALSLLETREEKGVFEYRILANIVHSQIELHKEYGGVFPILAKREHIKNLPLLYTQILKDAQIDEKEIDAIAVTEGPGLEPALWTGIVFAKELGERLSLPLIPVNHMEGHIVSALFTKTTIEKEFSQLKAVAFPALALLISGGHTEIIHIAQAATYKVLGRTRDDAIGEAFDKVARMLGFAYPGGPEISRYAALAREENLPHTITLPRPMIHSKDLDFSFSGLKTSVLYTVRELGTLTETHKKEIAREFEDAVTEVLITKVKQALEDNECQSLIVGGGVIANTHIRKAFETLATEASIPLYLPGAGLTGDNALMIVLAGALPFTQAHTQSHTHNAKGPTDIKARGNLSLELRD